ncbi:MAG: putative Peptidoglycan protein, partial [Mucilaginibacter sp.]|nr:putative Peptidoglycan protein [Mucilaginibacter sp.]
MAQFDPAFDITMRYEGGYANNTSDHGGETYIGNSIKFWHNWHVCPIVNSII